MNVRSVIFLLALLCASTAFAQETPSPPAAATGSWAPDRPEPGSVEKIKEYTTAPEYLPESVSYVPDSETVPSPTKALGHLAGAPDELSRVKDVHDYFRRLAGATDRVQVKVIGTSEEGREMIVALVSDPENLAALDRYRDVTARLADPRRTPREEARRLAAEGKVFYWFTGGLHSTETGSPEMLMELAYRLAVSEKPEIQAIRKNAIVMHHPGRRAGRPRPAGRLVLPPPARPQELTYEDLADDHLAALLGHYVCHDNNRDGMQRHPGAHPRHPRDLLRRSIRR